VFLNLLLQERQVLKTRMKMADSFQPTCCQQQLFLLLGLSTLLPKKEYFEVQRLTLKSKNDLALEMIEAFPARADGRIYNLMDNWNTSEKAINTTRDLMSLPP
jgi:hypothetical protein